MFGRPEVAYLAAGVTGLNAALWLVLGPVIGRSVRRRTERGIASLLDSMAAVGGQ